MNTFDPTKMDDAAQKAQEELAGWMDKCNQDQHQGIKFIAEWWNKYFMTAGHKRLGRVLLKIAKAK